MKFFDLSDPFYRPPWIRVAVVAVCFGWGLFEFSGGAAFWGTIFLAMGGFAAWQFVTIDYYSKETDRSEQGGEADE